MINVPSLPGPSPSPSSPASGQQQPAMWRQSPTSSCCCCCRGGLFCCRGCRGGGGGASRQLPSLTTACAGSPRHSFAGHWLLWHAGAGRDLGEDTLHDDSGSGWLGWAIVKFHEHLLIDILRQSAQRWIHPMHVPSFSFLCRHCAWRATARYSSTSSTSSSSG